MNSFRQFLAATALLLLSPLAFAQTPVASPTPDRATFIRTPPAPDFPRINGPRIYGERPGHPFLYHLPVTGVRPIAISAQGLPAGLTLDPSTGQITGAVALSGTYDVTFTATNSAGKGSAPLRIVIGNTICLTPPLGWNSWNCFGGNIDQTKIRGAADAMAATGLVDHGWTYINMDDRWQGSRDANGNILPTEKMGDVKALADYVHGKGLKLGLYSSPGPQTCAGAPGSWMHEDQDAATYAAWGIDYLKYDLCSYESIVMILRGEGYAKLLPPADAAEMLSLTKEFAVLAFRAYRRDPSTLPQSPLLAQFIEKTEGMEKPEAVARLRIVEPRINVLREEAAKVNHPLVDAIDIRIEMDPYAKMRGSLDKVNRDIVYSLCQYGRSSVWQWGAKVGANLWRTTGDISANWKSVESHGFKRNSLERWAGPGHWNDPDMLEVGNGDLTPDENYTHMTVWCMLSAPLLIGCDMPRMNPLIVSIFSNDEVIAVNQDALGKQGWMVRQAGEQEVWMKPLADGALAVAFFNRANAPAPVSIKWSDLKLKGPQSLRDLWRQKEVGVAPAGYSLTVAAHGAELFKVYPARKTSPIR